jgi:hypothetical protein
MSYQHLLYEVDRDARIGTVTLNKPERLNAIDQQDPSLVLAYWMRGSIRFPRASSPDICGLGPRSHVG